MEPIAIYTIPATETPDAGNGQDNPLAVLVNLQPVALGSVRNLDDAARSIREKGFTAAAFESIARAASFLEEYLRKNELLEERHLLPVLVRTDPAEVKTIREERRVMRNLFAGLVTLVGEIEGGRIHGSSVADLLRTAGETVTRIRRHIIHQNDVLTPLIRRRRAHAGVDPVANPMPTHGH